MILKAYNDEAVNSMVEKKWQFHDFNFTSDLGKAPRKIKQRKEERENKRLMLSSSNLFLKMSGI